MYTILVHGKCCTCTSAVHLIHMFCSWNTCMYIAIKMYSFQNLNNFFRRQYSISLEKIAEKLLKYFLRRITFSTFLFNTRFVCPTKCGDSTRWGSHEYLPVCELGESGWTWKFSRRLFSSLSNISYQWITVFHSHIVRYEFSNRLWF